MRRCKICRQFVWGRMSKHLDDKHPMVIYGQAVRLVPFGSYGSSEYDSPLMFDSVLPDPPVPSEPSAIFVEMPQPEVVTCVTDSSAPCSEPPPIPCSPEPAYQSCPSPDPSPSSYDSGSSPSGYDSGSSSSTDSSFSSSSDSSSW